MKRILIFITAMAFLLVVGGQWTTAHAASVTLAWGQDMSVPVTGWKIYQSETAGTYGPAVQTVIWDKVAKSEYEATVPVTVSSGALKTFYYVVTAYNEQGESGRSNEVSAAFDFRIPVVPSSLRAVTSAAP